MTAKAIGPCRATACDRMKILAQGLCSKHYKRWHQGILDVDIDHIPRRQVPQCRCGRNIYSDGLCSAHWQRQRLHGDPQWDKPLLIKNTGRYQDADGYIVLTGVRDHPLVRLGRSAIFEHHLVMAMHLNRPLHEGETVHHKNGVRDDNRIENLELWSGMHPRGARVSDQITWAKQIIEQYGTDEKRWS
jgi:hypothetical protein